ncbi:MAG: hypothetical protein WKF79_09435 [Nocardioides sp.]
MRDPDEFDAFYKSARERLLLQTYALTGDLSASRAAVRDAFVVAWHHWRKISRLSDPETPEDWVRPQAWRHAQRRHSARLWHRDKGLDTEARATLDALAKLPVTQRRALLLTQLAAVSMPQMAREIGLPLEDAERELQSGASQFALARDVPTSSVRSQLESLTPVVAAGACWPRATIIRRAGAARRRTHTTIGAAAAVAALLVSGALVTDAAGVRPSLDRREPAAAAGSPAPPVFDGPEEVALDQQAMLGTAQVRELVGRRGWRVTSTSDNAEGEELVFPCQQERYADPRGSAALLRTLEAPATKQGSKVSAIQSVETSASPRAARRAFETSLSWYAGCQVERVQLLKTHRVDAAGDRAVLLELRAWDAPVSTMTVGIARTGVYTTTTMTIVENDQPANAPALMRVLGGAVSNLCTLPDSGGCATSPRLTKTPPQPVGVAPAMLSAIDLPPVARVAEPWGGTEPRQARDNLAATRCDDASFAGPFDEAKIRSNLTRSFVIPGAKLPDTFGLTQSIGSLPPRQARAFVEDVRGKLARCPDQDLGTEVEQIAERDVKDADTSISVWRLRTELSDERSLSYSMAILRRGNAVAQIGFIPADEVTMPDDAFVALAYRALNRLVEMPRDERR